MVKMRRGFTLLELIIVIIILGVLATLGLTQYGRMVERSRGAEAKSILGDIRKFAAGYYLEYADLTGFPASPAANLGVSVDQIPSGCRTSHYFSYGVACGSATACTITATRCGAAGKVPSGGPAVGNTLTLGIDMSTGVDNWGGTGNY